MNFIIKDDPHFSVMDRYYATTNLMMQVKKLVGKSDEGEMTGVIERVGGERV